MSKRKAPEWSKLYVSHTVHPNLLRSECNVQ